MGRKNNSETITENIFRDFYGVKEFIEKSAIPKEYGFVSKNGTGYKGYPDFFKELQDFCIVVEAKADDHIAACAEVKHYMQFNNISKDILGIAVSGQEENFLNVTYYLKENNIGNIVEADLDDELLSIKNLIKIYKQTKKEEITTVESLTKTLTEINKEFQNENIVRDTDGLRSIQHKGRIDVDNKWNDIERTLLDSIFYHTEIKNISELRKIYDENGILNCYGIRPKIKSSYEIIKISDIFYVNNGTLASEKNKPGKFDFITAAEDWKKHNTYENDCEALVMAIGASGSLGRTHYVNGKFTAATVCCVLTPKPQKKYKISLKFYSYYFNTIRSQLRKNLKDGASKNTITPQKLEEYEIQYIPYEEQLQILENKIYKFEKLKKELKNTEIDLFNSIQEKTDK